MSGSQRKVEFEPAELDPFALPTETRGRFHLLMVAACLLAWSLPAYFSAVDRPSEGVSGYFQLTKEERELLQRFKHHGWSSLSRSEKAALMTAAERHGGLELRRHVARSLSSFGSALLVILGALAMTWLRRVDRWPPLLPEQAPKVFRDLETCCRRFGIVPTPRLALRPGVLDGLAVAGPDRPMLVLAGDRRRLDLCWSDLYRSVLLHELGHLVNGDFQVRERARWMWWWAGGMVTVVLAVLTAQKRFSEAGTLALRAGVFGAVIYLLWAALVRDRELYADLRAMTWGYGPALRRRLTLPAAHGAARTALGKWLNALGLWRMLSASRHPSNEERLAALTRPDQPFHISLRLSVAVGLLLAIASANGGTLFLDLMLPMGLLGALFSFLPIAGIWVAIGIVGGFLSLVLLWVGVWVSASLGVQALRRGVYGAWTGSGWLPGLRELWLPAIGLVLAFQAGLLPWTGLERLAVSSVGNFLFSVTAVWLWLSWIYTVGYWVLPAVPGPKRPKWLPTLTLAIAAVLWVPTTWPLAGRWLWTAGDRLIDGFGLKDSALGVQVLLSLLSVAFISAVVLAGAAVGLMALWRRRCPSCRDRPGLRLGLRERCSVCGADRPSWLRWRADPSWLDPKTFERTKARPAEEVS